MSNEWCVSPGVTDRYDLEALSKPFWIEIKRELTVGEQKRVDSAGFRGMTGFGKADPALVKPGDEAREAEITIDWKRQTFIRTEMYLTDWSLTDDKGNKLQIAATIPNLRKPIYDAIEKAINDHVEAQEADRKNAQAGVSKTSETLA